MRKKARRLGFGLATLFGIKRRGFFIPYRHADKLPPRAEQPGYAQLAPIFAAARPAFLELLQRIDAHSDALAAIGAEPPPAPRWTQDWFPRLDAAAAYVLVRDRKPRHIVEVGSGHSTRFICRAIGDGRLATQVTAIDPKPRADIEGLRATIIRSTLQEAGTLPFAELQAADMFFLDSSHILMPGTDVDLALNQILPALPAGVLVHVHDIFLPDDYPSSWDWRGYNEQLAVAALLQGGGYRLLWASRYAATRMREEVMASAAGKLPLIDGALESSLWLVKA